MRHVLPAGLVLSALLAIAPQSAGAQPLVRVRAETRIELGTVRQPSRVVIVGALRDDLGKPLPDREVEILAISDDPLGVRERRVVRTQADGRFHLELALPTGGYRLRALFDDEPDHARVEVERRLDLDRADVRLRVQVPGQGRLSLDEARHRIAVEVESDEGGGGLRIDLYNELEAKLGQGTTRADGRVEIVVPSERLGPPGAGRVIARSTEDARRAAAQTEFRVVRYRATSLTLSASRRVARTGERVVFRGRLADRSGPLDRRAVGLFVRDVHLGTVLTDASGRFEDALEIAPDARGPWSVHARFQSDAPWRASSASRTITIDVIGPTATPWPWLLLPIVLCGLVLLLVARRAPARPPTGAPKPAPRPAGIEAAPRKSLLADRTDIAGTVRDAREEEPLATARVTLVGANGESVDVPVDSSGKFQMAATPAGTFVLVVTAPGFARTETRVVVPHRGEWSSIAVRLESLRSRAMEVFRTVAIAVMPSSRWWGIWTPREVRDRGLASGRGGEALDRLARRVEHAAYAPEPPTDTAIVEIEADAREALGAAEDTAGSRDAPPPR